MTGHHLEIVPLSRHRRVHELDGECHTEYVDAEFRAPTPADVKGPVVEP